MAIRLTAQYIEVAVSGNAVGGLRVEAQNAAVGGTVDLGPNLRIEAQNAAVGGTVDLGPSLRIEAQNVAVGGTNPGQTPVLLDSLFISVVRPNDHRGLTSVLGTLGSGLATETLQLGAGAQGPSYIEPENTGMVGTRSSMAGVFLVPGKSLTGGALSDTGQIGVTDAVLNQHHILAFGANVLPPGDRFGDGTSTLALVSQADVAVAITLPAVTDMDIDGTWSVETVSSIKSRSATNTIALGSVTDHNWKFADAENTILVTQVGSPGLFTLYTSSSLILSGSDSDSGISDGDANNNLFLVQETDKFTTILTVGAETIIPEMIVTTEDQSINLSAENTLTLTQDENVAGPKTGDSSSTIPITVVADGTVNIFGRVAESDLDISATNPNGGEVTSNIHNLLATTPDPQSDPIELISGFTDNWTVFARLADTFDVEAANILELDQSLPQPTGKRSVDAENTLEILDFADDIAKRRAVTSTIVVTQSADASLVHSAVSTLGITSAVVEGFVNLSAENTLTIQQFSRAKELIRDSNTTLELTQEVQSSIRMLDATSTIDVTQDIDVRRPWYRNAVVKVGRVSTDLGDGVLLISETEEVEQLLGGGPTEGADPIAPFDLDPTASDILQGLEISILQEASVVINGVRNPTSVIQVGSVATAVLIDSNAIGLEATTFVGLTQRVNRSITAEAETVIDTLSVSAIGNTNTVDLSNTLDTLGQEVVVQITHAPESVDSQIDLKHALGYSITRDTTDCDYTPFISESDADTTPPRPILPEAYHSAALEGVRFRLVYPAFDTGATIDSLNLRAPEFGNREGISATRIVRESMGGTLTVFADPDWPKVHTLTMSFAALKQTQARDLLDFMERWLGQEIGIYDYEGRIWKGVITNPTEAVTQDGLERYSVNLEIEAERVHQLNRSALSNLGLAVESEQDEALAFSSVTMGSLADYSLDPVQSGISTLDLADNADYNRVPVHPGSNHLSVIGRASRNSFYYRVAESGISLGDSGRFIEFDDFGNLVHNWDARSILDADGDPISLWSDIAGTVNLSNLGLARPTFRENVLNGQPVVEFRHSVAVQRMLSNTPDSVFNNTTKTGTIFIVLVTRQAMTNENNLVFGTNPGSPDSTVLWLGGDASSERPVAYKSPEGLVGLETPASTIGTNSAQVLVWQRNNNQVILRRNRVTQVGHTLSTNPVPLSDDLYVGGLGTGNSADMDIAQILVYDDIMDLADVKSIEGIIGSIWGV